MTEKHQQQAREIVTAHAQHSVVVRAEQLIDAFASALSSLNRETREVLEGLRGKSGCWCRDGNPLGILEHDVACLATRVLWNKVQG